MINRVLKKLSTLLAENIKIQISQMAFDSKLLSDNIDQLKVLAAKPCLEIIKTKTKVKSLKEVEMKVFSQMGEDGIIQYLINNIDVSCKKFIEFGVEDYSESNTRYLLMNDNWEGLVLDSSENNINRLYNQDYAWKHSLTAKHAFITRENINQLISENGFNGNIGLLSIDVDGNDYWIWDAITGINPDIVICEYNSVFGNNRPITIPYNADFSLTQYHFSNLYFGASLPALYELGLKKGYVFVGSNSAGSNAFFVNKEKAGRLKEFSLEEGYVESKFRSSRNERGELTFLSGAERLNVIKGMDVFNIKKNSIEKI